MADVAVIGCGPAGLLSAHAVERAGLRVDILSEQPVQSPMAQGVFLHDAIPGITHRLPDAYLIFQKVGTGEMYSRKVYGEVRSTSWDRYEVGLRPAWALAPAYAALWGRYGDRVQRVRVNAGVARDLVRKYPLVINTAPAWALCEGGHHFESADIWLVEGAPAEVRENNVVYNGLEQDKWYRAQDLFGYRVTEYAQAPDQKCGSRKGYKVTQTDCDCHPKIMRNGRFGTWKPGVLLHQSYQRVEELMENVT
jgi:hypothetical protein